MLTLGLQGLKVRLRIDSLSEWINRSKWKEVLVLPLLDARIQLSPVGSFLCGLNFSLEDVERVVGLALDLVGLVLLVLYDAVVHQLLLVR